MATGARVRYSRRSATGEQAKVETVILSTPWGSLESFAGDLITEQLHDYGAHQRSDLAFLLSLLRPGDTVVDVGAHVGTYTVPIAQTVGAAGRVIAVEAVEDHYVLLERNLERNGLTDRVHAVHALAGGVAKSFLGASAGNSGSARFGDKGGGRKEKFPGVKVDDIAPSGVALVKIDVEGMEAEVLRSARGLLHRDRPVVVFETGTGSDIREVTDQFGGLDYSFLVNLHQRSGHEDVFEAGRLPSPSGRGLASRLVLPLPLLDVVAIPNDSNRWPASVRSASDTTSVLAYRRARLTLGRLRLSIRSRLAPTPAERPSPT
jgi:FkbM family methyltransferase